MPNEYREITLPNKEDLETLQKLQDICRDFQAEIRLLGYLPRSLPPVFTLLETISGKILLGAKTKTRGVKPIDELKWQERLEIKEDILHLN